MMQRFEIFVNAITQINRSIQKLKTMEMAELGLKGTHVMCLFQLRQHPEGLTSVQLSQLCEEDKAAVSRALSELEQRGLTAVSAEPGHRRYRTPVTLTEAGHSITEQMDRKIQEAVQLGGQGCTDAERELFYRVLLRIADNLQQGAASEEMGKRL